MKNASPLESKGTERDHERHDPWGRAWMDQWHEIDDLPPAAKHPPGTGLLRQGAPAHGVYLIERGVVKLSRLEEHGRPVIIGLRRPGWMLGAASVLLGRPAAATAETLSQCTLRHIRSRAFRHLMKTNAHISWQLHQLHSREVYDQTLQVSGLGALSVRHRLEQFLWEQMTAQGLAASTGPVRLQLPLKQYELAQLICVTPQYVSQLLDRVERDGVLQRDKGWLIIRDPQQLWHRSEYEKA